ncbi:hypothetical protein LTR56_016423 [Elasticomyces elasticus]|nr:hypothetical protein LTR56_016423 [Elasticomyces elasticus]KAK3638145.1 hypothetical protein LTR22_017957 [Elasticomyces elasticus]KAK5763015.1 hypothetical protein LTS12_006799 [Elasticomyces elasticus]
MLMCCRILALAVLAGTSTAQLNTTTQNATTFSLQYGYPLLAFEKLAPGLVNTVGINQIRHSRSLNTADDTAVVKPNVDTLYSQAIFDLSHDDVVITIPEFPSSQFALFSYYDPFGNNFANTGTGNLESAGQYLLTSLSVGTPNPGVVANNDTSAPYEASIVSPSLYGIVLIKWLVNATNLDAVHGYQDAFTLRNITKSGAPSVGPYLSSLAGSDKSVSVAENVFNLLGELAFYTGPRERTDSQRVNSTLSVAGVSGDGAYKTSNDVDLELANKTALAGALLAGKDSQTSLNNGWTMNAENETGDFGTNYALRTAVAVSGYLQLKAPNAIYPSWSNVSEGPASGTGANESLLYTFSGKPPLAEPGFWSLTAYNADNYLIANDLDVYALGDRSNITYPDGSRVYGTNASSVADRMYQILLQPADVTPPTNWTSNWLPAPSGGGNLSVILRWYGARSTLTNGSYQYPIVTRQAAVRQGNSTSNGTITTGAPPVQTAGGVVSHESVPWLSIFCTLLVVAVS